MKTKIRVIICLIIYVLFLCSCDPPFTSYNKEYWDKKEQGLYPDMLDFPCTKWQCVEKDITFYFLDKGEFAIIGEYKEGEQTFRLVGGFEYEFLYFDLYSSVNISSSDKEGFIHCDKVPQGFIYTEYIYKDGNIICTINNSDVIDFEEGVTTLTFKNAGTIAQTLKTRWKCAELDMYIDEFDDIDGYYKGEIVIDGQKNLVQAFEIGNDNYYKFTIENGKINNYKEFTTYPLVLMLLEQDGEKLVGKISDSFIFEDREINYIPWDYKDATLTFTKEPINKQ